MSLHQRNAAIFRNWNWNWFPDCFLSDNASVHWSVEILMFMNRWGIIHQFICAYRPQRNGIKESNHRTIKTMITRTGNTVEEYVFGYNVMSIWVQWGPRNASSHELVFHVKKKQEYQEFRSRESNAAQPCLHRRKTSSKIKLRILPITLLYE